MQPTTPTPNPRPAPPAFEPVVELIRTQRQNVGYALLIASAVFLALTGWLGLKTSKLGPADAPPGAKDKAGDLLSGLPSDVPELTQPNQIDYIIGAVDTFAVFAGLGAAGAFLLAARAKPREEEQRTEARLVILVLGSHLGAVLIAAGALLFYQWNASLAKWLDKGDLVEARWIIIPLLMVVLGGALMFVSAQPARAEERNNSVVRKFIYGSNFGLTVLMVFVVLIIANAVVAMRVPNKLDTTSTGFYTLSPQTKQLLEGLEQPVHAYAIYQDSGDLVTEDTKQLLRSCQETNPSKFRVTVLSPALNKAEINKLKVDFPKAEREGVLLVVGDGGGDAQRHEFIRSDEFEESKPDAGGRTTPAFNGEPRLLRELMFLADSKQKPKIYFTQSSGELALGAGDRGDARRTAAGLKAYLEKNYFDVQPLAFDRAGPAKVPDDAAVVVIADPTDALPAAGVEAIRKYMTDPRPDGKKGKLVVLAGQQPGTDRDRKQVRLGIEGPVLQKFGVQLSDRYLYNVDSSAPQGQGSPVSLAVVTGEAQQARNPVALAFAAKLQRLPLLDCREVTADRAGGGAAQTVTVLQTLAGRLTWTQAEYAPTPADAWSAVSDRLEAISSSKATDAEKERQAAALSQELQLSQRPRPLAVFVSEGASARVAVFGCGWFVSDDVAARAKGQAPTLWLDLMGSTLDWIRDRPTVTGVSEKPYTVYTLKPGYDTLRMLWVPLGLALLAVTGLGAGVWVIRRR